MAESLHFTMPAYFLGDFPKLLNLISKFVVKRKEAFTFPKHPRGPQEA
jgi:hypothetical protein